MPDNTVKIPCSDCGSKDFKYPTDPKPDDVVTCNGCGRQTTYGVIVGASKKQALDAIKKGAGDFTD